MIIKQLSIFVENEAGRLAKVTQLLGDEKVNISALSVADTKEFGILRLIVSDTKKAVEVLKGNGFSVSLTDVICMTTEHKPGALAKALEIISKANISVEYMYAFAIVEKASIVLKVSDPIRAIDVLRENKLEVLKADELNKL